VCANTRLISRLTDCTSDRNALLSQAAELIAERGPAVPLDEIARAARVGNATLYRHFPDRRAVPRPPQAFQVGTVSVPDGKQTV
jgi:hypothetical protein